MIQSALFEYLQGGARPCDILLVADDAQAQKAEQIAQYKGESVVRFPDFRAHFGEDLRSYKEELSQLFLALFAYHSATKKPLIISPFSTLLYPLPKPSTLSKRTLAFGDRVDLASLKEELYAWGYGFVDIVQMQGEVSFRGDIIDIFAMGEEMPYRLSLFDDEVESIRYFDLDTQKSDKNELESMHIFPAFLALSVAEHSALLARIESCASDAFVKDIDALGLWHLGELAQPFVTGKRLATFQEVWREIEERLSYDTDVVSQELWKTIETIAPAKQFKTIVAPNVGDMIALHKEKKITLIAPNKSVLKQHALENIEGVTLLEAPYSFSLISAQELILSLNSTRRVRTTKRKATIILDELKIGDYVVHEQYGVGIFSAIEQANVLGGMQDFVVLEYQGADRVLIPVNALHTIDRYVADSGSLPALDRLGKSSFAKLKEAVKSKLFAIAAEIIKLAAARATIEAPRLVVEPSELHYFQSHAGFEYTQDQRRSIDEMVGDLGSGAVMDRLLSGDVGFGKTEVAMNAIYVAAKSGYQSALVVPTTLLSSQHYHSLERRFAAFGIRVAKYDRFTTTAQKSATLQGLEMGAIDVVVGTHALLGVQIARLGLVIIDEEHKFGVQQKEQLKELYAHTHLLSMSATPIPRSLNMALSKIKTLSQLLTPPHERKGVRSFVKSYDAKLVKEVISRELRRGGQIFYVFNNIAHMEGKRQQLLEIMPTLRIVALHSKINAATTEKELIAFEERRYDVMLATSIVESGIHMPNVNTIIIDGADRFGMADLHQLRGRVGRGHVEGYCYFFVESKEELTPEATKRLVALENNSYLGSGQALAYHDLEIRGGGNLIGEAQSGHIKQIGYGLYLRMLEDALAQLGAHEKAQHLDVDMRLGVNAFISERVVSEDRLRLELYRRLSLSKEVREVYEIEEEMVDRFGELDVPTRQFVTLMALKRMALALEIKSISNYGENIAITYRNETKESLKARSKDDDDILDALLKFLRNKEKK
ncbi:MAG: transcription-repair coupling factor [Sulfurovum sp. PC08-66]|nr:MAG: transcription-repair coupling factor [Sulfurovum sp. PC08-66]KIM12483.1 MAG: transcription-repair coupling factor [Sulfuricurvum sp. PC08-66]